MRELGFRLERFHSAMSHNAKNEMVAQLNIAAEALRMAVAMKDEGRADWIRREFSRIGAKAWVQGGKAYWEVAGEAPEPVQKPRLLVPGYDAPAFAQFRL